MKAMKICAVFSYVSAVCSYVAAIICLVDSYDVFMGIVSLLFGSAMLCFGSVWLNKMKNDNKEKKEMGYTFKLKKYVHMYNHLLTITKEQQSYEAIIESGVTEEETMLIWLEDFAISLEDVDIVKDELTKWFAMQSIKCIFYEGYRIK